MQFQYEIRLNSFITNESDNASGKKKHIVILNDHCKVKAKTTLIHRPLPTNPFEMCESKNNSNI